MRGLQAAGQVHLGGSHSRKLPTYQQVSAVSSVAGGSAGAHPHHSRAWGALTVPAVGTGRCGAPRPWPSCVERAAVLGAGAGVSE